jgi:hypothetical protein
LESALNRQNDAQVTAPDPDLERRQHVAAVTGVVIAGVLASFVVPGPYSWGSTLIGVILGLLLFGYGDLPASNREAIGFSAALAFVLLLVLGVALDSVLHISGWPSGDGGDQPQHYSDGWESGVAWSVLFGISLAVTLHRKRIARTSLVRRFDGTVCHWLKTGK